MRLRTLQASLVIAAMALGVLAYAQDAPGVVGTVYFKGGQSISGDILSAELGFRDGTGTGVGSELPGNGAIAIKTPDDGVVTIPAEQIAVVEAKWEQVEQAGRNPWEITELKVTRRDGSEAAGTPDWFMHASSVAIRTDDQVKRIHAFPLATDFSSDDLLVRIELAELPDAPAPVTPEPPAPVTPEPPAPETPEVTPEPPETEPAPVEPAPAAPAIEVTDPEAHPEMEISDVRVLPSQDVVLTLGCPHCKEQITLLLRVSMLQGLTTGGSGVTVTPVEPAEQ